MRWCRLAAAFLVALGASAVAAHAEPSTDPVVSLDRNEIAPGDRVRITMDGFKASVVTVSVCGNNALRGTGDCNMGASQSVQLDDGEAPTAFILPLEPPPVPCPCVVRVSDRLNQEIAFAPLTLIGFDTAAVETGPSIVQPLDVWIEARRAPAGILQRGRSSLGGPTAYDVTVTVKNRSAIAYSKVTISGLATRGGDELLQLTLDDPGAIAPGKSWQQTVRATVPGPSMGSVTWQVQVSTAGKTVAATTDTSARPMLLLAVGSFLVVDVFLLLIRATVRRHQRRALELAESPAEPALPAPDAVVAAA